MTSTLNSQASADKRDEQDYSDLESVNPTQMGGLGTWFLRDMWYFAIPSSRLKPGQMVSKTMLGEPVLIGRRSDGKVFALKDICPHQAVPLSDGHFDGKEVMCPFHGWKFDSAGTCTEIPSLCSDQKFPVCKIKTPKYPVREVKGTIWVYFGDEKEDLPDVVPEAPGLNDMLYESACTTLQLPTHIDYAALALIDPAHVPYIHKSWWWRSAKQLKEKTKHYVPDATGWTVVKHRPSAHSIVYKLFGKYIEDEFGFRLPGCRREYLTFAGRTLIAGISCLTPIDETHTELNHMTYWTIPGTKFVEPIIQYFVTVFLGQDQSIALRQAPLLKLKPKLVPTIKDAGTPGAWYLRLKKEWADAKREKRPFKNPVPDSILRWRS